MVYQDHSTKNIFNEPITNLHNSIMTTNSTVQMGDVSMSSIGAQEATAGQEESKLASDEASEKAVRKAAKRGATTTHGVVAQVPVNLQVTTAGRVEEAVRL